jgi:hypothetical protein
LHQDAARSPCEAREAASFALPAHKEKRDSLTSL